MLDTTIDIDTLSRAKVLDSDGDKVGTVSQVYVDDEGGKPMFVTVASGLFGSKENFVPLDTAEYHDDALYVAYDKKKITDAPAVKADGEINRDEEQEIYRYYGSTGSDSTAADQGADYGIGRGTTDTVGHDTSGPTTDDAMTRSEEQVHVGTEQVETGRARLRKHIVTEQQTVTVPVSHEEVHIEREPITDANRDEALDGPDLSEEEHEVVLTEERPVVAKETVPVERVSLGKEAVTDQQEVTTDVRSEQIEVDGADDQGLNR